MGIPKNIHIIHSDTFKEIDVTGQLSTLNHNGLKLTVLHEYTNYEKTLDVNNDSKADQIILERKIECVLSLSPITLKAWDYYYLRN